MWVALLAHDLPLRFKALALGALVSIIWFSGHYSSVAEGAS
jgi:hypothetical protein